MNGPKRRRKWLAAGLLLFLCWMGYRHRPLPLGEAPEWQGIVPGQTTERKSPPSGDRRRRSCIGRATVPRADVLVYRAHAPSAPEYTVYKYLDPVWGREEVWLPDQRVVGILVLGDWSIYNNKAEQVASYTVKSLAPGVWPS